MKIGVTSQNFRTITGHAGKARRFIVFQAEKNQPPSEIERLDLPKEMSMHEFRGAAHPIDELDVLITASCGEGFERKMLQREIVLVTTSETDPLEAAKAIIEGRPLPAPVEVNKESCH